MVHKAQPSRLLVTRPDAKIRVVESSATQLRLLEARAFVDRHLPHRDVVVVGASRGAADDFARSVAIRSGATIGLHRFSLTQLAARLAAPILAADGLGTGHAARLRSGVGARGVRGATRAGLSYFDPVAQNPRVSLARWRERSTSSGSARVAGPRLVGAAARRPDLSAARAVRASSSLTPLRRIARFSSTPSTRSAPRRSAGSDLFADTRRCFCSTFRLALASSSTSSRRSWSRASDERRARRCSSPFPSATSDALIASRPSVTRQRSSSKRERKTSPRCIATCSPARSRQSASFAATCDSSRRRAKDGVD